MRELGPGDELAGYRIEGLAGRGGMGLVYRARQRRPDRVVAIKVVAPELAADPEFRARFEQESATAAEIEHPNVIPVYEVGEEDGRLFISMRFVQGVDLGQLAKRAGRLESERVVRLIVQVAAALDAAHARGLVHRDVKPGNILVAQSDHVYLTDFGLTKRMTDSQGMTRTGAFVGTVDYIAPEQVEGRPVDARADLYALGCVAFELLSGQVPFPRDSDVAKLIAHVNDPPPHLTGVPEPLADAVQRAMAKDPADRFVSTGEFGRAVQAGIAGREHAGGEAPVARGGAAIRDQPTLGGQAPPLARPGPLAPASPPRQPPPGRARRWGLVALGGLILAGAIAAALVLALGSGGSAPAGQANNQTQGRPPAAPVTPANTTTTPQPTQTRIFSPTNANGNLAVSVTKTVKGDCFSTSETAGRPDAFRCSAGNNLFDPCFQVGQSEALCPTGGPWTNSGLLIKSGPPSGTLNQDQGTKGPPWAIQLADGVRCLELSGAVQVIAGQPLRYGCGGGIGLYGNVRRSGSAWTIFEGTAHNATLQLRPIAIAWF